MASGVGSQGYRGIAQSLIDAHGQFGIMNRATCDGFQPLLMAEERLD